MFNNKNSKIDHFNVSIFTYHWDRTVRGFSWLVPLRGHVLCRRWTGRSIPATFSGNRPPWLRPWEVARYQPLAGLSERWKPLTQNVTPEKIMKQVIKRILTKHQLHSRRICLEQAFFITPLGLSGGAESSQSLSFFLEFCVFSWVFGISPLTWKHLDNFLNFMV